MNDQKTCFVISPIGSENSDVRKRANQFLSLVAEPALEIFNFQVIRADMIPQPTAITSDIIRLVQESDICLIDLTDSNPNVFYECGRRHETGKPFIQLVEKGALSKIPFDVAGIRTIDYDLSTAETCRSSVVTLQKFIRGVVEAGFQSATSGVSMLSIAQGIERLERKINIFTSSSNQAMDLKSGTDTKLSVKDYLVNALQGFNAALENGDIEKAFIFAQRSKMKKDRDDYLWMLRILSGIGHKKSFELLEYEFSQFVSYEKMPDSAFDILTRIVTGISKYFETCGEIEESIVYLEKMLYKIKHTSWTNDEFIAYFYNTISLFYWINNQYDESLNSSELCVNLVDDNPAYLFNLLLSYERSTSDRDKNKLEAGIQNLSKMQGLDDDHLAFLRRHGILI